MQSPEGGGAGVTPFRRAGYPFSVSICHLVAKSRVFGGAARDEKPFAQRERKWRARAPGSSLRQESRHFAVANELDERLQVIGRRLTEHGKGDQVTHLLVQLLGASTLRQYRSEVERLRRHHQLDPKDAGAERHHFRQPAGG